MRSKKQLAKKAVPMAAAASVLATVTGCATDSPGPYGTELTPSIQTVPETSPTTPAITNTPTGDMDCFLTTACVRAMGLPDDCQELTVLRRFRDEHLMKTFAGRAEVARYYRIAPQVVLAIRQAASPEAEGIAIYQSLVSPAVKSIEAGNFDEAFQHYRQTVLALAQRFGVDAG